MTTDGLDEFWATHRQLVLTACEWRALLVEPEPLADRVHSVLAHDRHPPSLERAYRAINQVVRDAYFEAAGKRSFLDSFRGNGPGVANPPQDSTREKMLRDQLSRLPEKQRETVQLALWDQLDITELAQVLGVSPSEAGDRLQRALGRYSALVARKEPAQDSGDLAAAIRRLKPGRHSRWGTASG